jgi:hypothetical protein
LLAKIAEQCKKVLGGTMPDRNVSTSRDLIYHQHTKIIAKRAFAVSDGVQGLYPFCGLKHRGDKKFYDVIPPLLEKKYFRTIGKAGNDERNKRDYGPPILTLIRELMPASCISLRWSPL